MRKRLVKQFIIVLIFILILSLLIILIYFIGQPKPSCFDNIQNQDEEGIDCGGPCVSCEVIYAKDIEVLQTEAVLTQDNFYDILAKIKNPNQNYGADKIPFRFKFYDANNNLLGEYAGLTFILPNQTKYIVQTKVKIEDVRPINLVKVEFDKPNWQRLTIQVPQLAVLQKEFTLIEKNGLFDSQVRGILLNKSNLNFDKIDLDVMLYDSSRQLIALNTTEVRNILAGQERNFTAIWFNRVIDRVSFIEIEAETNLFNSDNLIK